MKCVLIVTMESQDATVIKKKVNNKVITCLGALTHFKILFALYMNVMKFSSRLTKVKQQNNNILVLIRL
jgi:transketolase N-terminal domain/subunit